MAGRLLSCYCVALLLGGAVYAGPKTRPWFVAQGKQKAAPPPQARPAPAPQQPKQQKQNQNKIQPLPSTAVDRFLRMTPEEREKALEKLPPERRQQMEENIARLEKLTPEERARLDQRMQIFNRLPQGRKDLMREAIMRLRGMNPAQRQAVLNSDDAKLRYNPEELQLLRDVMGVPPEE